MPKYTIPILTIALLLVIGVGCNKNKNTNQSANNNSTSTRSFSDGNRQAMFVNMTRGSLSDLVVGKSIMAVGTQNSDKTISANQIVVGLNAGGMGFGRNASSTFGTSSFHFVSSTDNRPIPAEFQNGTNQPPADSTNRPSGNFQRQTGSSQNGIARASGEILEKSNDSLVIKLPSGGSQIVFYSSSTEIYLPPTTTTLNKE